MARTILITRPRPAADRFARQVQARLGPDTPIVISPMMRIDPVDDPLPDAEQAGALIVTSAHAVPAAKRADAGRGLPCYCVGGATAQAARAAGLPAIDGGGDAETLLARITADAPRGPLYYLRGAHVAADLADQLAQDGYDTRQAVVYRQEAQPLSQEAQALLGRPDPVIVPLFSPRSARLFFDAACGTAPLLVAAISANAAANVPDDRVAALRVAACPAADAMLEAIEALASHPIRVESGTGRK